MSERKKLEFTYDRPGDGALPLFVDAEPGEPCAFQWRPDFYAEHLALTTGNAISGNADIPWDDANIQEIYIESRYALEVLNTFERPEWVEPLVRILPSQSSVVFDGGIEKVHPVAIFFKSLDFDFACQIAKRYGNGAAMFVGDAPVDTFPQCAICLFPFSLSCSSEYLAIATAAGAKIIASDAGSSIEWLTKYGKVGEWLVVYEHDAAEYVEAVKYIEGKPSTFGAICKP